MLSMFMLSYCWFAGDVTAAMLGVKNKAFLSPLGNELHFDANLAEKFQKERKSSTRLWRRYSTLRDLETVDITWQEAMVDAICSQGGDEGQSKSSFFCIDHQHFLLVTWL